MSFTRLTLLPALAVCLFARVGQAQEAESQMDSPGQVKDVAEVDARVPETVDSHQAETLFLRVRNENDKPKSMDTAVVSYRGDGPSGVRVDLIGAVHIGEASYYAELNRLFDEYDVLLYELVAPEGLQIPRGGVRPEGFNPVALMQDGAKSMLGLELQLEQIDYTKPHFVRADMTPRQMADKMAERGESALTLALDTFAEVMRQQNLVASQAAEVDEGEIVPELSLADLLGNPLKMKRVMAQQFALTGSLDQALGRSLTQLLIVDRNAEALKEFQKQLAAGKRKIGIFYGAAHLSDFEKHLTKDFGLKKIEQRWLTAWDLTRAKEPTLSEPMGLLLNILKALE